MTKEMKEHIESEMRDAIESNDQTRMMRVIARSFVSLVDCQMKTAERVKEMKYESELRNARLTVAVVIARGIYAFLFGGGFLVAYKIAKMLEVL